MSVECKQINVACIGDSLLWNQKPLEVTTFRGFYKNYPQNIFPYEGLNRWQSNTDKRIHWNTNALPGRLLQSLVDIHVIRDLLIPLYPFCALILALGTNDLKAEKNISGIELYITLVTVFNLIQSVYPHTHVVYLSPPAIDEKAVKLYGLWKYAGFSHKMIEFNNEIKNGELIKHPHFTYQKCNITPGGIDGVHFTPENNTMLGELLSLSVLHLINNNSIFSL